MVVVVGIEISRKKIWQNSFFLKERYYFHQQLFFSRVVIQNDKNIIC